MESTLDVPEHKKLNNAVLDPVNEVRLEGLAVMRSRHKRLAAAGINCSMVHDEAESTAAVEVACASVPRFSCRTHACSNLNTSITLTRCFSTAFLHH